MYSVDQPCLLSGILSTFAVRKIERLRWDFVYIVYFGVCVQKSDLCYFIDLHAHSTLLNGEHFIAAE